MAEARDLFRNEKSTEFVIVTIPTMMAVSESGRLAAALRKDSIPVSKIVVNQVRCAFGQRSHSFAWTPISPCCTC